MNKPTILCVDDELNVLLSLRAQLLRNFPDHNIEIAENGDEALEVVVELLANGIDLPLVIADQIMTGMKGDELLIALHKLHPQSLKVMLTGQAKAEEVGNVVNQGRLYRFIPKPWNEIDLNLTVSEALRSYQQNQQLQQQQVDLEQANHSLGALNVALEKDIQHRKQVEEELRQANMQLTLANAELVRVTRLKGEFLASMSHEFRTPLNAILGMSECLQDEEVFGELNELQTRAISTIAQSGRNLLELIDDILDLINIESGQLELKLMPTSIASLCRDSLNNVKFMAKKKDIRLDMQILENIGEITVDELRMRQALINLLNNAVKFTRQGGQVNLVVTCDRDRSRIQFQVSDTGIGIAPENLSKLFQTFMQVDGSLGRQYNGTGLGLALVKQIVELHQGTVEVESRFGSGSCFTISLPYSTF